MSRVKSSNTKPEIVLRKFLFSEGLRYRVNSTTLPGKPDIVLKKYKVAIFVHGCFWHGHSNCEAAKLPKSNLEYWTKKIHGNIIRDRRRTKELKKLGWRVFVIWECELRSLLSNPQKQQTLVSKITGKSL